MRVFLVTCKKVGGLAPDDEPFREALLRMDAQVEVHDWDAPDVPWADADVVVIRSCWDYHLRPAEFQLWIEQLRASGIRLWNPAEVVLWNLDKKYLMTLQEQGVEIPGTIYLPQSDPGVSLRETLLLHGWNDAVVKPSISATAYKTFRTSQQRASSDQPALQSILQSSGALVQEFANEVVEFGELSLQFFGGVFSHAVLKKAVAGDFRVQNDFGGTAQNYVPEASIVREAEGILRMAPGPILYARVDGILREGRFLLMELELIEPVLFLRDAPGSADRFAQALLGS